MSNYSKAAVRAALEAAAGVVDLTPDELEQISIGRTARPFSEFLGEEPGGYRPSFYDIDNKILADAYDAGRKAQGDPRRAFRGF
ncbi:hypothetical protein JJL56_31665 [Azospirillum sp. YIM DDC1]|uniref:Uncharacterized protein n=1 Tax=Azospirillum aestuarii TaxID=2802052 RepID=A0ABS1I8M8_9PROT|nr:hypothetical protein [Azospirillum aestuarii]MBK4723411.1 hypothetical protein [Azospirillum aestuarii]